MRVRIAVAILLAMMIVACNEQESKDKADDVDGDTAAAFHAFFPKHIDVFGVSVRGTPNTPDDKMLHAANVMAEYLDNDGDGEPDNPLVIQKLRDNKATLVMTVDRGELDLFDFEMLPDGEFQDLNAAETMPGAAAYGEFDATLEEVLHLISHGGLADAYPDVFGERPGTALGDAMDKARGGRFLEIPARYPDDAWYTYDDETCDYNCMATEYMYWALTSLLGAQEFAGRLEEIDNEWRLNTAAKLEEFDPAVYALLTDRNFALPMRLPRGNYSARSITFTGGEPVVATIGNAIESISIAKTRLLTENGVEYDLRIFAVPLAAGEDLAEIEIRFPDGRETVLSREYQRFPDGREHEAGLVEDPDSGRPVWMYINIGLPDLSDYAAGDYTFSASISGQRHSIVVPFGHTDTDATLEIPPFPTITTPDSGTTVHGTVAISIEPMAFDVNVFLGRQPREDEAAADFAEEASTTIPAGETQSKLLTLSPGQWGGDVSVGRAVTGVTAGVSWDVSVGAATEIDLLSVE